MSRDVPTIIRVIFQIVKFLVIRACNELIPAGDHYACDQVTVGIRDLIDTDIMLIHIDKNTVTRAEARAKAANMDAF